MKRESSKYYPGLDGLRTIAVFMVLLVHTLYRYAPWGWLGVQLFFVLSGFLITGILYDTRGSSTRYRTFYSRRALRIFPLYYFVLIAAAALSLHQGHPKHLWIWFLYLQNFAGYLPGMTHFDDLLMRHGVPFGAVGHFWSLAVEEQFYLIWPAVVFHTKSRQRLMAICTGGILLRLVLGAVLQRYAPQPWLQDGFLYRMLFTQCDAFLMGGLLALWLRAPGASVQQRLRHAPLVAAAAALGYAVLLLVVQHTLGFEGAFYYSNPWQALLGIPLANVVSTCVVAAALVSGGSLQRFGAWQPVKWLGQISYGLYVYHLFLYVFIRDEVNRFTAGWPGGKDGLWVFVATSVATILVAWLSYMLLESPFLRLKRHFVTSHPGVPSGQTLT